MSVADAVAYIRTNADKPHRVPFIPSDPTGQVVYEAGCGAGLKLLGWAVRGARVYGVDGSPAQVARVKAHAAALGVEASIAHGWLENFETLTKDFPRPDLIVNSAVIHHVSGWRDLLKQFGRVLKPDGILYLTWCDPSLSLAGFNMKNQIAYRLGWNAKSRTMIGRILFGWWDRNRNKMGVEAESFYADLYAAYYIPITARRMCKEIVSAGFDLIESRPMLGKGFFRFKHGPRVFVCQKRSATRVPE